MSDNKELKQVLAKALRTRTDMIEINAVVEDETAQVVRFRWTKHYFRYMAVVPASGLPQLYREV